MSFFVLTRLYVVTCLDRFVVLRGQIVKGLNPKITKKSHKIKISHYCTSSAGIRANNSRYRCNNRQRFYFQFKASSKYELTYLSQYLKLHNSIPSAGLERTKCSWRLCNAPFCAISKVIDK